MTLATAIGILLAAGERLWWVGVVAILSFIAVSMIALGNLFTEVHVMDFSVQRWLGGVMLAGPNLLFALMVYGRLRLAFGWQSVEQGNVTNLPGVDWIANQSFAMAWVMNALGVVVAPITVIFVWRMLG